MSGELRDFDPDKVTITWALPTGAIQLHVGLIDGPAAIQDSMTRPRAARQDDRQGNQVRNRTRIRSGTLTLTYMAAAPINGVLTGIIQSEDAGVNQVGLLTIRNLNGLELATYAGAGIDQEPNIAFGDVAGDRVYVFGYAKRKLIATGTPAL